MLKKILNQQIIVIDMCPQANVSEILLGGNGKGQNNLDILFEKQLTIASYIKKIESEGRAILSKNINDYFININHYNEQLPDNLYLLAGDNELDICSNIINFLATSPARGAWKDSRTILLDLINEYASHNEREQVYFIDCNPSFSAYTELAIIASTKLVIPCTADNASIRGLKNVFKLLYGSDQEENQYVQFNEKVSENKIELPKIYRIIQNKSRSHQKNAAKAFLANKEQIDVVIGELDKKYSDNFFDSERKVYNIKDGNTLAAVIHHTGKMLETVKSTEEIHGTPTTVNDSQKKAFMEDLNLLVGQL